MEETTSSELMDIEAVLLYTRLEEHTLSHLIARNQFPLPLHLSNGRNLRWYREEIEDWLHDPRWGRSQVNPR